MRPFHFAILTLTALTGFACSAESSMGSAEDAMDTAATYGTLTTNSGQTGTTTTPAPMASWVSIDGLLEVTGGEVNTDTSTLSLDFFDSELNSLCSEVRTVASATSDVSPTTEPSLFGWWYLDLAPSSCTSDFPDLLRLGLGPWDPLLAAAADAEGLNGDDLYGLYVQDNPLSALVVFGVAGSAAQFAGYEPPITDGDLPDSTYQLRSLYLLPIGP